MSIVTYGFSKCNGIGVYGFAKPCEEKRGTKKLSRYYQQIIHEWSHTFTFTLHKNTSYSRNLKINQKKLHGIEYNHIINHTILKTIDKVFGITHTLSKQYNYTQNIPILPKKRHYWDNSTKLTIKRRHYADYTARVRDNTPLLLFLYLKLKQKS